MFDPRKIIASLNRYRVEYVIIGGFAATVHGCPEQTFDLDILYEDSAENRARLLTALAELEAQWDRPLTEEILQQQPVFALNTRFGDLDIMTWVPGTDTFDAMRAQSKLYDIGGEQARVLEVPALIATKEAAADPNPRKQAALLYLKRLIADST